MDDNQMDRRLEDRESGEPGEPGEKWTSDVQSEGLIRRIFFTGKGKELILREGTEEERVSDELVIVWGDVMRALADQGIVKNNGDGSYTKMKEGFRRTDMYPDTRTFLMNIQNFSHRLDLRKKENLITFLRVLLSNDDYIYPKKHPDSFKNLDHLSRELGDFIFHHYPLTPQKKAGLIISLEDTLIAKCFKVDRGWPSKGTLKVKAESVVNEIYDLLHIE